MIPQRLSAYLAVLIATQKCSVGAEGRERDNHIGHLFLLSVARDLRHVPLGGSQLHSQRKGSATISFLFPFRGVFLFLFRLKKM
jgi:hypothetical protein